MPVRNNQGELCLDDSERMKAWVEHYKGLLNVEFPWDEGALPDAPPVKGPPPPITDKMVTKALAKMKSGKSAGPSGIIAAMLKAAGSKGIDFLPELIKSVVKHGKIPEDWEISFILNLYKGKGDALNRGNYRGLKLTEHVMKIMERIIDGIKREMIAIDEMQFAFVPGRGTTDAIFIIRQLKEKFLSRKDLNDKNLTLFFAFVDLEKAFDCVPRKVLWEGLWERWGSKSGECVKYKLCTTMHAAELELALSTVRNSKSVLGPPGLCSQPSTFYHCAWGFI